MPFTLVGLGEILWDLLPEGKQLGGAPANFAFLGQQLGGESYVVSGVGDDELGCEILANLDGLGLSRDYIAVDATYPTGTVSVKLDEAGKPEYVIHEGVAWDHIAWNSDFSALGVNATPYVTAHWPNAVP